MGTESATPTADRCPNCHAFLPLAAPDARHRRCEYCGVSVPVALDPPRQSRPRPERAQAVPPGVSRTLGMGLWVSLLAPFLVGGSIFWSTQRSIQRAQQTIASLPSAALSASRGAATSRAVTAPSPDRPPPTDGRGHPIDTHRRSRLPVGDPSLRNELCHISSMQMSAVIAANRASAAACFDRELAEYPKNVGLISDWDVEVDGLGHAHAARGRLHLLDYKRRPDERAAQKLDLPGAAALRCAESAIRSWAFPKYSPKDGARMRMHCSFNFVIRDL